MAKKVRAEGHHIVHSFFNKRGLKAESTNLSTERNTSTPQKMIDIQANKEQQLCLLQGKHPVATTPNSTDKAVAQVTNDYPIIQQRTTAPSYKQNLPFNNQKYVDVLHTDQLGEGKYAGETNIASGSSMTRISREYEKLDRRTMEPRHETSVDSPRDDLRKRKDVSICLIGNRMSREYQQLDRRTMEYRQERFGGLPTGYMGQNNNHNQQRETLEPKDVAPTDHSEMWVRHTCTSDAQASRNVEKQELDRVTTLHAGKNVLTPGYGDTSPGLESNGKNAMVHRECI